MKTAPAFQTNHGWKSWCPFNESQMIILRMNWCFLSLDIFTCHSLCLTRWKCRSISVRGTMCRSIWRCAIHPLHMFYPNLMDRLHTLLCMFYQTFWVCMCISIISQNNFLFDFAKQSQAPSPKGTGKAPPRRTNDNKKPSDRITHAGTIKISRSE